MGSEIPPVLPFQREESILAAADKRYLFSLLKRERKGGFEGFSKSPKGSLSNSFCPAENFRKLPIPIS
jgi:hypothetical protein